MRRVGDCGEIVKPQEFRPVLTTLTATTLLEYNTKATSQLFEPDRYRRSLFQIMTDGFVRSATGKRCYPRSRTHRRGFSSFRCLTTVRINLNHDRLMHVCHHRAVPSPLRRAYTVGKMHFSISNLPRIKELDMIMDRLAMASAEFT